MSIHSGTVLEETAPRWAFVVEDDIPLLVAHRMTLDGGVRRHRAVGIEASASWTLLTTCARTGAK